MAHLAGGLSDRRPWRFWVVFDDRNGDLESRTCFLDIYQRVDPAAARGEEGRRGGSESSTACRPSHGWGGGWQRKREGPLPLSLPLPLGATVPTCAAPASTPS